MLLLIWSWQWTMMIPQPCIRHIGKNQLPYIVQYQNLHHCNICAVYTELLQVWIKNFCNLMLLSILHEYCKYLKQNMRYQTPLLPIKTFKWSEISLFLHQSNGGITLVIRASTNHSAIYAYATECHFSMFVLRALLGNYLSTRI